MRAEGFDLVCLSADADTERLLEAVVRRGIERQCLPPIAIRYLRDPMRDSSVVRNAHTLLLPYAREPLPKFLVIWDHHGSGRECDTPAAVESDVKGLIARLGIPITDILTLAIAPELELLLEPVWSGVLDILGQLGSRTRPNSAFHSRDPKKSLQEAAKAAGVKLAPHVFTTLGDRASLPQLKRTVPGKRLADQLESWFPPRTPA